MQVTTQRRQDEALNVVADEVVRHKGQVLSRSETSLSARFAKKFSWLWFLVLVGVFYLPWYWTRSEGSLAVSVAATGDGEDAAPSCAVVFTARGKRAVAAAKRSAKRLR